MVGVGIIGVGVIGDAIAASDYAVLPSSSRVLRLLVRITWPNAVVTRMVDAVGPFLTADGHLWRGVNIVEGVDVFEQAINGEALVVNLSLVGVSGDEANAVWLLYTNNEIIGATVEILLQACDELDQPVGDPEVRFTGTIDNIIFDDRVEKRQGTSRIESKVTVEVTNLFTLRRMTSGSVLSEVDQKARAAILNPLGDPDKFCDRVVAMANKTVVWPRWSST